MPWAPAHAVPRGGLPIWDEPDGNRQPIHQLEAGLSVEAVEGRGGWTRVVCENGFTGWVDGSKLVAATADGRSSRAGRWIAVAVAVAAVGVGGVLVVAGGGNDDDDGAGGSSDAGLVALDVPEGWSLSDDGLVAAEDADDLDADEPEGPVVRATVGDPEDTDFEALTDVALADDAGFEFTEPDEQNIDGFDAVSIIVRGGGRVQALVVVHPPDEDTVFFTLDSPEDRFDELRDLLASVPGIDAG